ncbi:MAG: amidohydrolase family protein, partial [Bdellovibrionaceae bacterium]|nr:amidohydrolase family protein [Pseudobdellovibrionaceae bacterium]
NVVSTFLGAHAIPKNTTAQEYLNDLKKDLTIIAKKNLAKRVDIFVEKGYFSVAEAKDYLLFAKSLGFEVCIHAEQLSRTGSALLAHEISAQSSDHNICVSDSDIQKIAKSETTYVLLPNADFYIHCPYPPARKMIDAGVRVALSTDFNPGTSPSQSIQLVGVLARLKMNMSLPEVFAAWTVGAAHALGMERERGALLPGYSADFFATDANWSEFFYDLLHPSISKVWVSGEQKV